MKKNELRTFANWTKTLITLFIIVFCAGYSIYYCVRRLWIEAVVFAVITLIFFVVLYYNGSVVVINKAGITLRFLWIRRFHFSWSEIQEIGVIGDRVLLRGNGEKVGTRYIYFSPKRMDKQERFDMGLRWPPRDMIYTIYSEEKISFIQSIWSSKIELYNVGDLEL